MNSRVSSWQTWQWTLDWLDFTVHYGELCERRTRSTRNWRGILGTFWYHI